MKCSHSKMPFSQSADAYLLLRVHRLLPGGTQMSYLVWYFSSVKSSHIPACQPVPLNPQTSRPKKPLSTSLQKSIPYPPPNHEETSAYGFPQPNALGCLFYFVLWQERRIKLPGLSGRTSSLPYIIIITRSLGERKCSKSLKYKAIKTAGFYCRDCHCH